MELYPDIVMSKGLFDFNWAWSCPTRRVLCDLVDGVVLGLFIARRAAWTFSTLLCPWTSLASCVVVVCRVVSDLNRLHDTTFVSVQACRVLVTVSMALS